jgi:hypothetical protein
LTSSGVALARSRNGALNYSAASMRLPLAPGISLRPLISMGECFLHDSGVSRRRVAKLGLLGNFEN